MATYTKTNAQASNKPAYHTTFKDTYQEVTNEIIKLLEEGTAIWQCGWNASGLPKNITTGIAYRGWNIFRLNLHSMKNHYPTADYLTFKQAQYLGGNIKRGEKGTQIVYWAEIQVKSTNSNDEQAITVNDNVQQTKTGMVPKAHIVFNIAQTEGITIAQADLTFKSKKKQIAACEQVVADMPHKPTIITSGSKGLLLTSVRYGSGT